MLQREGKVDIILGKDGESILDLFLGKGKLLLTSFRNRDKSFDELGNSTLLTLCLSYLVFLIDESVTGIAHGHDNQPLGRHLIRQNIKEAVLSCKPAGAICLHLPTEGCC